MGPGRDLSPVYEECRLAVADLVRGLPAVTLDAEVPATPGWRVRDVISHLAGDVACVLAGDLPAAFFLAFGSAEGIESLNRWTSAHIEQRRTLSLDEVLAEWAVSSNELVACMRGEQPWPPGVPDQLAPGVIVTDIGVHLHDLYGAVGVAGDRDGPPVRVGVAGYISVMDSRLRGDGVGTLTFDLGDKARIAGEGEPHATVTADRFELFRALSGRRAPDQVRAFSWDGDPEPFIPYFYPYGERSSALVE